MAKVIGRTGALGLGLETVKGTAVAPAFFIPVQSYSFDDKVEYIKNDSAMGRIEEFNAADIVKKWSEGDYAGKIFVDSIGAELSLVFGQSPVSTERGSSDVFDHAYSLANDNSHKSGTIAYVDDIQDLRYPYCVVNTWALEIAVDDYVKRTIALVGKTSTPAAGNTPVFTDEVEFIPSQISLKLATNKAGLDGATAINATAFNMEINKNAEALYALGSVNPQDIINKQFGVTGSIELYFEDITQRTYALTNIHQAIRIAMIDATVDLGGSHNPELRFDLAEVVFEEFERGWDANDPLKQTLNFEALFSIADGESIVARLTNTQTGSTY